VFLEVHDDPARAKSDAQNALHLDLLEPLLHRLMALDAVVKRREPPSQVQRVGAPGVVRG
jgi:3-deoxy-D-manno-octulosonic acid (KDO) 8-phosphate synthase